MDASTDLLKYANRKQAATYSGCFSATAKRSASGSLATITLHPFSLEAFIDKFCESTTGILNRFLIIGV